MGKYSNECGGSYNANRAAGSGYNANRSGDKRKRSGGGAYTVRSAELCCEPEYARRPAEPCCEPEYARRPAEPCCEPEYARHPAEPCCEREQDGCPACSYVWRSAERACCEEKREAEYEVCPAALHLHEVQGSVQVSGGSCRAHNHRFATVTCEPVILKNGCHAHRLTFRTDAYDGHCHEFSGCTAENTEICSGHVHYLEGRTSEDAGHCHEFRCITHIENPTGE